MVSMIHCLKGLVLSAMFRFVSFYVELLEIEGG